MKIRNWSDFQHYKKLGGTPRWIKLYHRLVDDKEWHDLSGESAKGLVMLWLIASEQGGELPSIQQLSFRLRISENRVTALLSDCSHWIEMDSREALETLYSSSRDTLEQKRIEENRIEENLSPVETTGGAFDTFWEAYPKKLSKKDALRAWKKVGDSKLSEVLASLEVWKKTADWHKDGGQFIPYPATWLNKGLWRENPQTAVAVSHEGMFDLENVEEIRRRRRLQ